MLLQQVQRLKVSLLPGLLIDACSRRHHRLLLRSSLHGATALTHAGVDSSNLNVLLSACVKSHRLDDALSLFDATSATDACSWNTIIAGLARARRFQKAISRFVRMTRSPIKPDKFTYSTIVTCCDLAAGRQIHARMIKAVPQNLDPLLGTNLMRMYAEHEDMHDARKVFDEITERDTVAWNALLDCYSKSGTGEMCTETFLQMWKDGVRMDEFTYATVLNEFAAQIWTFRGMQVHSLIIRTGFCSDLFTCNSLLNMYSKGGFFGSLVKLFEEMPTCDVVSWTAITTGFVSGGYQEYALDCFNLMRKDKVEPNAFTLGSLISSCARGNAFETGKQYHALSFKYGLVLDVFVGSAIMNMYSSYGEMDDALRIFRGLPETDIASWNGIICGLAQNGEASKALHLFDEMVQFHPNMVPNGITFVGVLSACSHGGLVQRGCSCFTDMIKVYSIEPQAEHCGCMVDLFARAGLLAEAETMIQSTSFEEDVVILGSLLGACRKHGNIVMAKRIIEKLCAYDPMNTSNYVLLANIHTNRKEWDDAVEVRNAIFTERAAKPAGSSWIEIKGHVHTFTSGFMDHGKFELLYEVLQSLHLILFSGETKVDSLS